MVRAAEDLARLRRGGAGHSGLLRIEDWERGGRGREGGCVRVVRAGREEDWPVGLQNIIWM